MDTTNPNGKIVRVTIEHENGVVIQVTGAEAEKWQDGVEHTATYCLTHNVRFPELNWEVVRGSHTEKPPVGKNQAKKK